MHRSVRLMTAVTFVLVALSGLVIVAASAGAESVPDPSTTPLPDGSGLNRERYRVIADFDGDGHDDLAISQSLSLFGSGGGRFHIFLSEGQGGYVRIGETFCHARSMAVERRLTHGRLWVYRKAGAAEGSLGYHEIREWKMSEFRSIEVFPGDGGTRMGRAILEAVLDNSYSSMRIQRSTTTGRRVRWEDVPGPGR